jgi:hypothetical protein
MKANSDSQRAAQHARSLFDGRDNACELSWKEIVRAVGMGKS